MKIIFVTDLHGSRAKYKHVFEAAKRHAAAAVVNGGDMLTLEGDLHRSQKKFIEGFLDPYFAGYQKAGIYHLGYLGNDDLGILDSCFDQVCSKYSHVVNLAQRGFELGQFEFIGMNWVADYPFQLKDRCRKDRKDYVFQRQFGPGLLSKERGFRQLEDWSSYATTLPTIEDELEALPEPRDPDKAIYVMHMPPARVGLDVCQSGDEVGSLAVCRFIEKKQPLLTLHGHIHESPSRSGKWKAEMGKTICVQPGQASYGVVTYVLIDLDGMKLERIEEPI